MPEVCMESPGGKSMTSSRLSASVPEQLTVNPFSFEARTSYDAHEALTLLRSSRFSVKEKPRDDDIWKRPPPDFRLQVYNPKPPKRNSREAMKPWKYGTIPNQKQKSQENNNFLPPIAFTTNKKTETKPFITQFHIMDSFEARKEFAESGQHPRDVYRMPGHHDFRGYPPISKYGLPEFTTSYDKDPYNIKFHTERPNIIRGLPDKPPTERDVTGEQMAPPLHQPPKWEARLHLPQEEKWPNKYHAYTRYRLPWRSPQEVLMDRMEETLSSQWKKEASAAVLPSNDLSQHDTTDRNERNNKTSSSVSHSR